MAVDRTRVIRAATGVAVILLGACEGTVETAVWGPQSGLNAGLADNDDSSGAGFPARGPNGSPLGTNDSSGSGTPVTGANPTTPTLPDPADGSIVCGQPGVGGSPLRRLTSAEYDNTVRDLLGDTTQPGRMFVADTQVGLFHNSAKTQTVPQLLAEQYLDSATALAEGIEDVPALMGCDPEGSAGDSCVRAFIDNFGRRAFRRPLTLEESTGLLGVFQAGNTAEGAEMGVRGVVASVLASPNFLFRPEFGAGPSPVIPGAMTLTPYERASRLAQLMWAAGPDDELLDAAEAGQLETRPQVELQARRMLEDPRARVAVTDFYNQWFGMDRIETTSKDAAAYPQFDEDMRAAMIEETRHFIDDVIWNGDARLTTLLTASYSFVNGPLAELYGVPHTGDPSAFTKVELDPEQRSGVLTHASMLAAYARPDQSSPVKRGQWVRVRLLCQELPDPPANVPQLPEPKQGISNRERFAMHTGNPACSGCHQLIDGLGFGLENYDGLGRFRTMDQGVPVDASGEIIQTRDIDGKYSGGAALADLLASSGQVRDCAPTQWLRFSLGREEEEADNCSIVSLRDAFEQSGGDLKELMIALTQTDAFWNYRQPE